MNKLLWSLNYYYICLKVIIDELKHYRWHKFNPVVMYRRFQWRKPLKLTYIQCLRLFIWRLKHGCTWRRCAWNLSARYKEYGYRPEDYNEYDQDSIDSNMMCGQDVIKYPWAHSDQMVGKDYCESAQMLLHMEDCEDWN